MKTPLEILNDIHIAAPCPVPWDAMQGDNLMRHCAECDKQVYDLSELTAQQAVNLIREKEGKLCIQLYRRKDGTVLTADCPVGVRARMRRFWREGAALAASLATFLFFSGCESSGDSECKNSEQSSQTKKTEKEECTRTGGVGPPCDVPPPPPPQS